jgi:hypothetical protein
LATTVLALAVQAKRRGTEVCSDRGLGNSGSDVSLKTERKKVNQLLIVMVHYLSNLENYLKNFQTKTRSIIGMFLVRRDLRSSTF